MVKKEYSWRITFEKGVWSVLYFGVPALIEIVLRGNPSLASLTVGGMLTMMANWLKNRNV